MKQRKRQTTAQQLRRAAYARVYNAVRRADPETRRRLLRVFWRGARAA